MYEVFLLYAETIFTISLKLATNEGVFTSQHITVILHKDLIFSAGMFLWSYYAAQVTSRFGLFKASDGSYCKKKSFLISTNGSNSYQLLCIHTLANCAYDKNTVLN